VTKQLLVENLSARTQLTKHQIEDVLSALGDVVGETMRKGDKVSVTGFGTFYLGSRAARRGVSPLDGSEIQIPRMAMPHFRAGKKLKDTVR
jgi:DNA-binding protein HU-beta